MIGIEKSTLKRLKSLPALFRKQDAEKVAPHATVFLSRALKNGLIHRLNRGNYINSFLYGFPSLEQAACFIRPPAYISCEWALHYHGISLQAPMVCTVVTLSPSVGKARRLIYQDVTIEFSKISPALFFGFENIGEYQMARPEKAILDTLHLRKQMPVADELDLSNVNLDSMLSMAGRFPKVVLRRALSLMDLLDVKGPWDT